MALIAAMAVQIEGGKWNKSGIHIDGPATADAPRISARALPPQVERVLHDLMQ